MSQIVPEIFMMDSTLTPKQGQIQARRTKALQLYLRKLTVNEIAKHLDVDEKTIDRDLAEILKDKRETLQESLKSDTGLQQLVGESLMALDEIIRENWLLYHQQNLPPKMKLMLLKNLNATYSEKLLLIMKIGLVPTIPIKIQPTTSSESLKKLPEPSEHKQRLLREFNAFMHAKYAYAQNEEDNLAYERAISDTERDLTSFE